MVRCIRFSVIAACSSFLFVVIVAFYGGIMASVFQLARVSIRLLDGPWLMDSAGFLRAVGLVIVFTFLLRCCHLLAQGVLRLVTDEHDADLGVEVGLPLPEREYPELHSLVAEVGRLVKAPLPNEIQVVQTASCYVTEQRTFALSTRRHLTLALGLPHLAVLSLSELKVILAHELAHFRCGDTRFQVFFCRFQQSLISWINHAEGKWWRGIDPLYWFCRAYLLLLSYSSAPTKKHLELRADVLSAEAYGGELASLTLLKEWLLARQFDAAVEAYAASFSGTEAGTSTNVYRWFTKRWHDFSRAGHAYLLRRLAEVERPSFFDSHPTVAQRVEAMGKIAPRLQPDSTPARHLVSDLNDIEDKLHVTLFGCDKAERATHV